MSSPLSIAAVGDISFEGPSTDRPTGHIFDSVFSALAVADLVIGNLEGPLVEKAKPVTGKCTLRGSPRWASILKKAGFMVLSLANNHIMDHGEEGLISTLRALDEAGLIYVGAGKDLEAACAPAFVNISGWRIAFLGRSSVLVSSPSYAGKEHAGVAFFDGEETISRIRACRRDADIVILMMHWGMEEYLFPSPNQRKLAVEFIEAGADLVLGHHPHVIQGVELVKSGIVCYSLGNFIFDEFSWSFIDHEGQKQDRIESLSEENRKGGILQMVYTQNGLESYDLLPTIIQPDGKVKLDNFTERKKEFDRLSSRLQWLGYRFFWQAYSIRQEWLLRLKPLMQGKYTLAKLRKLRPKHFKQLINTMRRSAKIAAGKSTSPYD